jgi:hypothetical protein
MALNAQGFALLDLPPVTDEILGSYDDLPVDEYMGNGTRFKKFSQYKMTWQPSRPGAWGFELLPHRDYTAYKKFNKVAGGIRRSYEPIKVDLTPTIALGAAQFPLDVSDEWQINVHQNRTRASADTDGPLTPEGIHHDGHDFVMIAVLRRHNVSGAITRLWNPGEPAPFWTGALAAGTAVLLDDRAILHDVTDVRSADGGPANRDIFIVAFSRWSHKWYGEEHDEQALTQGTM